MSYNDNIIIIFFNMRMRMKTKCYIILSEKKCTYHISIVIALAVNGNSRNVRETDYVLRTTTVEQRDG